MADTKTSGLGALAANPADGDLFMVVDVSDTTMAATGTNKYLVASYVSFRTNTETLTNKTLTAPVVGDFTAAGHSHQNAAGGGQLDHGLALTGLTDDDHTQYLLATGTRAGASAGAQTFTNGIIVPAGDGIIIVGANSTAYDDPAIIVARPITAAVAGSSHGFVDDSQIDSGYSYAAFDVQTDIAGSADYTTRHFAGFQSNGTYASSQNIGDWYAYTADLIISGAGSVVNYYGARVTNPTATGAGGYTNKYGYYAAVMAGATTNNYQFFAAGTTGKSYIGGTLLVNDQTESPVARLVVKSLAANSKIFVGKNSAGAEIAQLFDDASSDAQLYLYNSVPTATIVLNTNGDSYLTSGAVGIGTAAPGIDKLAVYTSGGNNIVSSTGSGGQGILSATTYRANANGSSYQMRSARGTLAAPTVSLNNDRVGIFIAYGYSGAGAGFRESSGIEFYIDGEPDTAGSTTDMPGRIVFTVSPDGSATRAEAMRIINSGYVGFGGITAPTALLHAAASTTARASLCIPHGAAPTSPVNGDIWTTTTAMLLQLNGTTKNIAVGTTGSAFTQTYSTAARTVNAYTTDTEAAYTGQDNLQAGSVYAKYADLEALRVAYTNLEAGFLNLLQVVTAVIDDLQAFSVSG